MSVGAVPSHKANNSLVMIFIQIMLGGKKDYLLPILHTLALMKISRSTIDCLNILKRHRQGAGGGVMVHLVSPQYLSHGEGNSGNGSKTKKLRDKLLLLLQTMK